jgi:DNA-binding LytR/AlgR family response regulator
VFLLFNYFWVWTELTWSAYFLLLGEFFIVSIIPLGVIYFFSGINQQKESTTETLLFESENGKEKLSIQADDFIYLTSEDNYISIFFESSGELKNRLLRNTMKRVEQEFQRSKYILRCHRSYIINPKKITRVTQESSGIKLMLKGSIEIPVSAKYEPNIKEQVEL